MAVLRLTRPDESELQPRVQPGPAEGIATPHGQLRRRHSLPAHRRRLKVELFRNASKPWTMNAIHDIDALSMALPYRHVVVPDREMAGPLSRFGSGPRHGTKIITTSPSYQTPCPNWQSKRGTRQEIERAGTAVAALCCCTRGSGTHQTSARQTRGSPKSCGPAASAGPSRTDVLVATRY